MIYNLALLHPSLLVHHHSSSVLIILELILGTLLTYSHLTITTFEIVYGLLVWGFILYFLSCLLLHLIITIIFLTHFHTFLMYFCISYIGMHHAHFALHHTYITSLRNSADIITCHFYCLSAIISLCHTHGSAPGYPLIS